MNRYGIAAAVLGALAGLALTLGVVPVAQAAPAGIDQNVNTAARKAVWQMEWLPGVAATTLTAAQTLPDRKALAFQNLSAATVFLGFDAVNPVSTSKLGWKLAPGESASFDFGSGIAVKAVSTAATTTGAGLQVLQAK